MVYKWINIVNENCTFCRFNVKSRIQIQVYGQWFKFHRHLPVVLTNDGEHETCLVSKCVKKKKGR